MLDLTEDEQLIAEAILDARKVQEFIWRELSLEKHEGFNSNIWRYVFQKRVDKISEVNINSKHYKIELRKRILQQAALSIVALKILEKL